MKRWRVEWRWRPPFEISWARRPLDTANYSDIVTFVMMFFVAVGAAVVFGYMFATKIYPITTGAPLVVRFVIKSFLAVSMIGLIALLIHQSFGFLTMRTLNVVKNFYPPYHWWFHIAGTRLELPDHLVTKDAIHGACDIAHRYLFVFNDTWSHEFRSVTFLRKNDAMRFKLAYF